MNTEQKPIVKTVEEVVKEHTLSVLEMCCGDKVLAARTLGVTTKTLYNWIDKWDLRATHIRHHEKPKRVSEFYEY